MLMKRRVESCPESIQRALERSTSPRRTQDYESLLEQQSRIKTSSISSRSYQDTPSPITLQYGSQHVLITPSTRCSSRSTPLSRLSTAATATPKSGGEQLQRINLLNDSIRDPLREDHHHHHRSKAEETIKKEFVPTQHLASDDFPQFPSLRQSPSTALCLIDQISINGDDNNNDAITTEQWRHHHTNVTTISDIASSLFLLIRAILYQYRHFWIALIAIVIGFRLFISLFRYAIVIGILFFFFPPFYNTTKALFTSLFPPLQQPTTVLSQPTTAIKQRLRDLPQNQPPITEAPETQMSSSSAAKRQQIPSWLRFTPIGEFGVPSTPFKLSSSTPATTMPASAFVQKKSQKKMGLSVYDGASVVERQEIIQMTQKLKRFITELCNCLVSTEAQDSLLSSVLSQLGLRYVVEHPLAAFFSLDLNDNSIVNLNDRHLPQTLINLANSMQQQERQIGTQLIQLLVQRRQLEKYLMIFPGEQRTVCLRRLSRFGTINGLEMEYSVYHPTLSNPPMTDGDIIHHLLFNWLAQELPSLKTDIFAHTHLSVPPPQSSQTVWGQHAPSVSSVFSIQKLPTDLPSVPGTFYKLTEFTSTTKSTVTEVSWDDFGVIEGVARFLVYLKNSRSDVIAQAGAELTQLLMLQD